MNLWFWSIILLSGCAVSGLTWAFIGAFSESAKTVTGLYEDEISTTLESMFLFIPAKKLVDVSVMVAATVFLLSMLPFCRMTPIWLPFIGGIVAIIPAAIAFHAPKWVVSFLKTKRLERFNLQLQETLPMMSNALRAGFSINQAFESVAESSEIPMKQEVTLFLQQLRVGVSFSDALSAFEQRVGSEDLTLVCTAIDIARKSGGNLTEIFDTIAETIRARQRIHQHVRSLTAQGRLQGLIIGAMPFLLGIGMTIFKPALMLPFIASLVGGLTLVAVIVLVILGGLIIRKIVTIDV
ncbi:MAG: type II secretion system F family protein [Kiritimatiellae bacterium]|nr:type II secretion system F family protein [Kiritimatiellia bacterium]